MKEATMLYKVGTMLETNSGVYDYIIVDAGVEGEIESALKNGWHRTTQEADADNLDSDLDGEVTRDELEQKAKELGISFNARTSDEVLLDRIADKLDE